MWLSFAIACAMGGAVAFVPGFLAALALGLVYIEAAGFAPVLSICFYALASIVFALVGIPVNGWILFGTGCAIGAILLLVSKCVCKTTRIKLQTSVDKRQWNRLAPWAPLIACTVALGVTFFVFVMSLGSPDNFVQNYDNAYHLSRAQGFLDSGNYSSLYISFYPSAWHCFVTMIASCTGIQTTAAVNAATVAVEAVCYPLSIYALLATLFGDNSRRTILGCIACASIAYFPWRLILFGPLYPNILSFALMPAVCAAFILFIKALMQQKSWVRPLALFIVGGIALALTQPNSIFSAAVFLVPFCAYSIWRFCRSKGKSAAIATIVAMAFVAIVALIWVGLFNASFMQGVVTYDRDPRLGLTDALRHGFSLCFTLYRPQAIAGFLVVVGLVALLRSKDLVWLIPAYLFTFALYVVAITQGDNLNILTGFWYSDYYRLAAATCVFAIPLLACGLDAVFEVCVSKLALFCAKTEWCQAGYRGKRARLGRVLRTLNTCLFALLALLLFVLNTFPIEITPYIMPYRLRAYGYDAVIFELKDSFWVGNWRYLKEDEINFLKETKELVGEDEVVNQPYDGSVFANALCGLNVLFNQFNGAQISENGRMLLNNLKNYATDPAVQKAVEALDAKYVLMLDQWDSSLEGLDGQEGTWYDLGYNPADWQGINQIDENTPGFTLLLSEGDMRLYRIDSVQ